MSQDSTTIENAAAIIERFGGIRPMASKIAVPVTTVQGWKKRDAIPMSRLEQILAAAKEHNVDISDILKVAAPANENMQDGVSAISLMDKPKELSASRETPKETPRFDEALKKAPAMAPPKPISGTVTGAAMPNVVYEDIVKKVTQVERSALIKSAIINAVLIVIATGSVVLLLWPETKMSQNGRRITALERNVSQLEDNMTAYQKAQAAAAAAQSTAQNAVAAVQNQAQQAVQSATNETKIIAHDALAPDAGSLDQRINRLQGHINEITNAMTLGNLTQHVQALEQSIDGQNQLASAWGSVAALASGTPSDSLDGALQNAAQQNPAMQQTFSGVAPQDVRAASEMLGAAELDFALGKDNTPFAHNIDALKTLTPNDPALSADLDKLAPYAQTGVLSPATLAKNFDQTSTQIVNASLTGDNVSLADRAKAHLNDVLQVQKNGELISGTPTQAVVSKAQQSLQQNDIAGAIAALQALNGSAAAIAAPWIAQAQGTMTAQQMKAELNQKFGFAAQAAVGDGSSPSH